MMEWLPLFRAKDWIALVVLIGCLSLTAFGINHLVTGLSTMIVGYYFGRRTDYAAERTESILLQKKRPSRSEDTQKLKKKK